MVTKNTRSPRQYTGVRAIRPPDLTVTTRAPLVTDTAFIKGQLWLDTLNVASYQFSGTTWISLGSGTVGAINTITGDSGGPETPLAGNFSLLGTANQITVTGAANKQTFSVSATFVGPGSIRSVTTMVAGTGLTATTGNIVASAGNITATLGSVGAATTVTAGTGITATTGNIVASTGNITSTLGSVGAATTVTAGTSITATLGAITATNGNLVLGTAGNKIISTSVGATTAAGANSFGKVTLVGGTATVATTAVTANSIIMLTRQSVGATGANPLGMITVGTIVAGTSFVISAKTTANSGTDVATDVSVIGWMIIN
jgi:hypothetical protein